MKKSPKNSPKRIGEPDWETAPSPLLQAREFRNSLPPSRPTKILSKQNNSLPRWPKPPLNPRRIPVPKRPQPIKQPFFKRLPHALLSRTPPPHPLLLNPRLQKQTLLPPPNSSAPIVLRIVSRQLGLQLRIRLFPKRSQVPRHLQRPPIRT